MKAETSEQANRPQWAGQDGFFESWVLYVFRAFDAEAPEQGFAIQYETFTPTADTGLDSRCAVSLSIFDAAAKQPVRVIRSLLDEEDFHADDHGFLIRVGACTLGNSFARGTMRRSTPPHLVKWELHYRPAERETVLLPASLAALPLTATIRHANCGLEVNGTLQVDTHRYEVRAAPGLQLHRYGTRPFEERTRLYAPAASTGRSALTDLISVRPQRKLGRLALPALTTMKVRDGDDHWERISLKQAVQAETRMVQPTSLSFRSAANKTLVRARAYAPRELFATMSERAPTGEARFTARTTLADASTEVFVRRGRRHHPVRQLTRRRGAAMIIHGQEVPKGLSALSWTQTTEDSATAQRAEPKPAKPEAIYVLSALPKRDLVVRKASQSWSPGATTLVLPTHETIIEALDGLEPGLGAELQRRFGFVPSLVEIVPRIALWLTEDADSRPLENPAYQPKVRYLIVAHATCRSVELLGRGEPNPSSFTQLAASFAGFLPASLETWTSESLEIPSSPSIAINGVLQKPEQAPTSTPRELLLRLARALQRPLRAGTVLLTHPASPPRPRALLNRLRREDRFDLLADAIDHDAAQSDALGVGDRITISAPGRASVEFTLTL